ncbi:hypothetical protein HGRIS_002740 [Hohenbuehelia grisea]|uniref:Ubiquitin-like protease family profile domain-containing protein n=1 Tax=Hohenbuehelia grisea TaxID=104357 RepID=A0ABR3JMS9_9AGAR
MTQMNGEVLKPILLRSSTPGANDKVLSYLQSMDGHDLEIPAGSEIGARPSTPKVESPKATRGSEAGHLETLANSPVSYGRAREVDGADDDGKSNTQDGRRTEGGDSVALPIREPGPTDPPGPKYESYDSGPSFGNFGPLPDDPQFHQHAAQNPYTAANPYANGSWQPPWGAPQGALWGPGPPNGMTPGFPSKVPLPESVASPPQTSINIAVESPSSPRSKSQAASKTSRAPSNIPDHQVPNSPPKSPSRASNRHEGDRPFSPLSGKSQTTARGTTYPPLPETVAGDDVATGIYSPTKARSQARSKAPSISPSDSLSQFHSKSRKSKTLSQAAGSVMSGGGHGQPRPFFPYWNAPTAEDLLHAAVRGRSMVIPEVDEKQSSVAPSHKEPSIVPSHHSKVASAVPSHLSPSKKAPSRVSAASKQPSVVSRHTSKAPSQAHASEREGSATPTPSRPHSPYLNNEEQRIVDEALAAAHTPRTSYYAASTLGPDVVNSHFHDMDLCILLHQEKDPNGHEVVKRALRKAIRQRVKKLGMNHDNESINQFRKLHDHDPSVHLGDDAEEPPKWATDLKRELVLMQQRIESLGPKIENLRQVPPPASQTGGEGSRYGLEYADDGGYTQTPMTQTVNIHTQPGTMADSMYQVPETEIIDESRAAGSQRYDDDGEEFDDGTEHHRGFTTDAETRTRQSDHSSEMRDDSPGQQFLEEELYKLRQKPGGSQSGLSHRTWEVARDDDGDVFDDDGDDHDHDHDHDHAVSGLPTIPDSQTGRQSPPLPPIPANGSRDVVHTPQQGWHPGEYSTETQTLLPWQKIHQRLLNWAMIWPTSELDGALNSTTRGHQVDEIALSIWSTQTYKRYVRTRLTDSPQGVVDRLFVPPNMADAISTAVFNGRHGDACGMLRDLWSPFGLPGMPRLLIVLAKHRSDANHWVVHRFSLPDGGLTTYDSYPERTLPDGRPLGWWFAIRIAWPNAIYPSPDHLMQKMVRLHRPMQLPIDNSVAAAGIWRNLLMGSRAERSLDLERLRDLINTEVKNLRQRKLMGKLSIGAPRPTWEDMN